MSQSPTQRVLDTLATVKRDKHVPPRPSEDSEKVVYFSRWRMYPAWVVDEDERTGRVTVRYWDDETGRCEEKTVPSYKVMR